MAIHAHNVVSYGRVGRCFRVRAYHQPADWNALGRTLDERTYTSFRRAVSGAKQMADLYGAAFDEAEMRRYFGKGSE